LPVNSNEIRDLFLSFFTEKKHKVLPSSSLIPHGDPTLLLTTAGMVQIKPFFLGIATPPNPRLASCQKCFRTTDIDSVGDNKHLTFFEMLGNFSVGDYFKKEAVAWGWEFVTKRLHLPAEKLWVTIFLDDDEAFKIWRDIGFPEERIVRLGEKDNFWGPAGDSGPCGPCSEIHYDFGEKYGCGKPDCDPSCSCGRFSEIWNLVFTQYNQDRDGKRIPLPKPNIDTGMGLERIVAACNATPTVYETDLFTPLLDKVRKLASISRKMNEETDRSIKVVAEHSRGVSFLIADGVLPSNEGRGYVLRRLLRRACFMGRRLGIEHAFMGEMAQTVIDKMGNVYPELVANNKFILEVIKNEEEKFYDTLDAGINLCEKAITEAKNQKRDCLLNEEVFKFWDTYGFPFELSSEIAREHGLAVDRDGFELEMEKQRDRARSAHKFTNDLSAVGLNSKHNAESTKFVGYDELATKSHIIDILDEKASTSFDRVSQGQKVIVMIDRTPFYGEMGGQVGDKGIIRSEKGTFDVINAIYLPSGGLALLGQVNKGSLAVGDTVDAVVDESLRLDIARNHTATHILQSVLRRVLGSHVAQRGSLVAPDRLRFDFVQLSGITKDQLKEVQAGVNEVIRKDLSVLTNTCSYNEAISDGATAIFEEKYGDTVRMVKIGEPRVSAELCGGTHVRSTGEIGYFQIISEASIGTGLRRIEAVTGRGAESFINERLAIIEQLSSEFKSTPSELTAKISNISANLSDVTKLVTSLQRELSKYEVDKLVAGNLKVISNVNALISRVQPMPAASMMEMADMLKAKINSGVIVLASVYEDKPVFIAAATQDLVKKGIHSGKLVKKVAEIAGGGGGGKPEMAQAGARNIDKVDDALAATPKFIEELLSGGHA
jgi:alanyl-tRNA synthetase